MERMNAYTRTGERGSAVVDVEGMAVDLITVMKAGGITKESFLDLLATTWEQVDITLDLSGVKKDS